MKSLIPLVATLLALPPGGPAAAGAQVHIPLAPYGDSWLRTVKVAIAGDTLDFLFDTGGGVTVISPELARQVGCTPSGRSHGYRMRGDQVETPVCRDVPLAVGGVSRRVEASVFDLMSLIGPDAPRVDGMISLQTFDGETVTLDLPSGRLTVETPESARARVATMTPLDVRLATGVHGGEVGMFIGIPIGGAQYWFGWDSGHNGTTYVAPWVATALDMTGDTATAELELAPGMRVTLPVRRMEIIHDGMFSAGTIARAVWTVDLAGEQMWVGTMDQARQ